MGARDSTSTFAEAIEQLRRSVQRGDRYAVAAELDWLLLAHGEQAEVHELASAHYFKSGQRERCIAHLQSAMARASAHDWALMCRLGRIAYALGLLETARDVFCLAEVAAPDKAEAAQLSGFSLLALRRPDDALLALRRAHRLDPMDKATLEKLSDLEFDIGFPADALPVMRELAAAQPLDVDAQLKLGVVLGRLFDHQAASVHYQDALHRLPGSADLWMALAQSMEYLGEKGISEDAYRRALKLRPRWAPPLGRLLGLNRKAPDPEWLSLARELMADHELPASDLAILGYELGKFYDAAGEHPQAMSAWRRANEARRLVTGPFDHAKLSSLLTRTLEAFPEGTFPAVCKPALPLAPRMVFIVGMPRSGTTLTEQIIASHPQAHGCGELLDLTLLANRLQSEDGKEWPEAAGGGISEQQVRTMAASYLASAQRHANAAAACLVDKAPLNFFFLGLAAQLFPEARVVWCRRDARDVAISIYGEDFSLDAAFATSFEGIAAYQRAEAALMCHWRRTLPLPMFELNYEQLVTRPEPVAKQLIQFVGLSWDDRCLAFHESKRIVQTPSRWQVRQPVHARSIGRWRHYESVMPLELFLD